MKSKDLNSYEKQENEQNKNFAVASSGALFGDNKTNADAHRKAFAKHNNFLRTSLNAAAKIQMSSNASAQSSKGFKNMKNSPKKSKEKDRYYNQNNLVLNTAALKEEIGKTFSI